MRPPLNKIYVLFALLIVGLTSLIPSSINAQQRELNGRVINAENLTPLKSVAIWVSSSGKYTQSDKEGYFRIVVDTKKDAIHFNLMGYQPFIHQVESPINFNEQELLTLQIELIPRDLALDQIVVQGVRALTNDGTQLQASVNGVEDLVGNIAGVSLMQRANFALDPMIRGFQGAQIGLTIDGMKVYGACVDRMDPASSYIEMENLATIEVNKGSSDLSKASQVGGSLNFVTQGAKLNQGLQLNHESGVASAALMRRSRTAVEYSKSRWGLRTSFSYRGAEDFTAGNNEKIDASGFEKRNYKVDGLVKINHHHQLEASFLGDDAWNVGFPSLLMDATLAQSRMFSLTHNWENHKENGFSATQKVYANTVDHWMDDRNRDVRTRAVMNGMFMPMFGYTRTEGLYNTYAWDLPKFSWKVSVDAHRMRAFGDMWMYSLFPNIPDMYLLNLGNVELWNTALNASATFNVSPKTSATISIRADYSDRDVKNEEMKAIFEGYWQTNTTRNQYLLPSASMVVKRQLSSFGQLNLSLAHNSRLPSHVENYGHYVYNYIDGFFYTGRPDLKPEQATTADARILLYNNSIQVNLGIYWTELQNLIVGLDADDNNIGALSGGSYQFRVYGNAKRARMLGLESSLFAKLAKEWTLNANLSAVYAQNLSFNEPMPFIAPVHGALVLTWNGDKTRIETESEWALAQNRIATRAGIEDKTDGYNLLHIRAAYTLNKKIEIKLAVENIFDNYVINHLSFGNLPMLGRNIMTSIKYQL
jgi:iron complex outermembrane receptor protein